MDTAGLDAGYWVRNLRERVRFEVRNLRERVRFESVTRLLVEKGSSVSWSRVRIRC